MKILRMLAASLALSIGVATSASAVTVATGATGSGSVGGFTVGAGRTIVDTGNGLYDNNPASTTPTSTWIWDAGGNVSNTFSFVFDLTGFDASTATLSGTWGVDNIGTASLNGNLLSEIFFGFGAFQNLTSFVTSNSAFFNSGLNTLSFDVTTLGGGAGLRAGVTVTADASAVSPVPVPAAGFLLLAGLAGLGLARRRKHLG